MKKFKLDPFKTSEKDTCTLCFEASSELGSLPKCNHLICKRCFKNDVEPKAIESKASFIGCPSHGCISVFPSKMIFSIFSESPKEDNKSLASQQNLNYEQFQIKNCPKCQICIEKLSINRKIFCKNCNLEFCSICGKSENHDYWSCLKQSKNDMYYVFLALFVMFFPVSSLFFLTFWFYFEAESKNLYKNPEQVKNKCVSILIFVSLTIGSVLIYLLVIIMMPLNFVVYIMSNIYIKILNYNENLEILVIISVLILFIPLGVIGAVIFVLFYIFSPLIGIALLIFKLTLMRRDYI